MHKVASVTKKLVPQPTFGERASMRGTGLGAAIIGAGFIGEVHSRAIRATGSNLVAVADGDLARSEAAAQRLGASLGVASAEELLRLSDVDVVHICTPNHLHAPLARMAIAAGKHVICEKPLATSRTDAEELANRADSAGVVAAVPFIYRYYPTVQEARSRVEQGQTGPIRLIHGSYLQDWLSRPSDVNWRVDPSLGGPSRTFADIGVHWCDLIEHVTGQRIVSLSARLATAMPTRNASEPEVAAERVTTEDAATLIFTTDGGATGALVASQVTPGRKNRLWFSIDGAESSLVFDQEQPETLWVGGRDAVTILMRGGEAMSPDANRLTILPAGHPQGYQDCFNGFVADVYSAVAGGQAHSAMPTFRDGVRAAVLTEAVLASHACRGWVDVSVTSQSRQSA
jgi:predicted dehydrogenase